MAAYTILSFEAANKSDTAGIEEYKCFDVALDNSNVVNCNMVTIPVMTCWGQACTCSIHVADGCTNGLVNDGNSNMFVEYTFNICVNAESITFNGHIQSYKSTCSIYGI